MSGGIAVGPGRKAGQSATQPAPEKGWNTRDSVSEMKPGFALLLDNWFPGQGRIDIRRGYRIQSSGMGAAVKSVMAWEGPAGRKLFGFANNKIWNATTFQGTASDVTAGSAITSDVWNGVNFGGRLTAMNEGGAVTPRQYDGTNWADTGFTGVTQSNLVHVNAYRERLYLTETGKLKVWYAGASSITGALTAFDMQYAFRKGGYLMFMATASRDTGQGPDDYAVFVSSIGEVLVYEGLNPGDTTWSLIGRYYTGVPLSRRGYANIGGDLAILTRSGLIPLSKIVQQDRTRESDIALDANISPTVNQAARDYGDNFGWEVILYPRGTRGMVNVPIVDSSQSHQYVWNTITGAWCRFKGMNSLCWTLYNDRPYFGGPDGVIYEADVTNGDNGTAILFDVRPAFSYLGKRGLRKQFHLARPIIIADAAATLSVDLEVDFDEVSASNLVTLTGGTGTDWDAGDWDDFDWAAGEQTYRHNVYGVVGIGECASLRLRGSLQNVQLALNAFTLYWVPASWLA